MEPEFEIVGAVEDGRALLDAAAKLNPDIILLDITMPLLSGLEAARCLRKQRPHIKLIFLTMHTDPIYVAEAMACGSQRLPAETLGRLRTGHGDPRSV